MKKFTSMILVLTMALSLTSVFADVDYGEELENQPQKTYEMSFSDVPDGYWAHDYIAEMVGRGVIKGYPDGKFRPELFVSREEFAKIMTLAAGLTPAVPDFDAYSDVNRWDWSAPYIYAASGYLTGYYYGENKLQEFRPTAPALREDIAVALVKLKAYDVSVADVGMIKDMFSDFDTISPRLQSYVAVAVSKGLVSGYEDGTFRAQDTVTRAEAATLLWRAYQYGSGNKIAQPGIIIQEPQATQTPAPTTAPTTSPKPTVKPTQTPVLEKTPEPTKTPEPVVEKKWKVETIASVDDIKSMICTEKGIVVLDGTEIKLINGDGQIQVLYNLETDFLFEGETTKNKFKIDKISLHYDYNNKKAYLMLMKESSNYSGVLYGLWDKSVIYKGYVDDRFEDIIGFLSDGTPILRFYATYWESSGNRTAYLLKNNERVKYAGTLGGPNSVYFVSNDILYNYDYNQIGKHDLALDTWDKIEDDIESKSKVIHALGGSIYTYNDDNNFYVLDLRGNSKLFISPGDINIMDFLPLKDIGFFNVDADNNIIFYDTNAKVLRKISKQSKYENS